MKIIIVEDEFLILEDLKSVLEDFGYNHIITASSFSNALTLFQEHEPDFAIIDIGLVGKKNGIDIANVIISKYNIPFIYLTGNTDKNMLNLAKLSNPYAILLKPFQPEEIRIAIDLATHKHAQHLLKTKQPNTQISGVYIKVDDGYKQIFFDDILYIKSSTVYIKIYTTYGKIYTIRFSISDFYMKLNQSIFMRIHRSYIVNEKYINKINQTNITVQNQYIPIGKKYKDQLFNVLNIT